MNDKNDKYSLFGGAKIQKMALCVKEKGITIYGVLGWRVVRGLVKDARAGEVVVFKILGLVPAAETQLQESVAEAKD